MPRLRIILFVGVMLIYLSYPYLMIRSQERILESGELLRFELIPVDPVDAFRGRYLVLHYETPRIPGPSGLDYGTAIYLTLQTDNRGFARFSHAYLQEPEGLLYLKGTVMETVGSKIRYNLPDNMLRYYLNEHTAPLAEKVFNELLAQSTTEGEKVLAYAQVRLLNGSALIEELYFEGIPIGDYLKQKAVNLQ